MKRFISITVGALSLSALSHAAETSGNIHEVIITASALEKSGDLVGQPVNVLSGQALRDKVASTLGETLSGEIGISSASFGPGVGYPVIRGQTGNRVKVLQDNLGTLDAASASPDHANSIEPLIAEQIEVLRGPATLRFGSGAIGGVVNVIDNRIPSEIPEQTGGAVEIRHATVNDGKTGVFKLDGGAGSFAWHLDGLYRDSNNVEIDGPAQLEEEHEEHEEEEHEEEEGEEEHEEATTSGFIGNSDTEAWSLTGGFSWITDKGFWGLSISQLENEYGIPPGAHGHAEEEHEEEEHEEEEHEEEEEGHEEEEVIRIDLEQTRIDLKGEHALSGDFLQKFKLRIGYNDYEHTELEGSEVGTRFTNEGIEGLAELTHAHQDNWRGVTGIQWQVNEFAAIGDEAFIPQSDIERFGLFWVEEVTRGDWVFEAGARIEEQRIDPQEVSTDALCSTVDTSQEVDHQPFSLSGSAIWHATEQHHFTLGVTHAQRAPSVEELFSCGAHLATGTFDVGNSDLDEETSMNLELAYHLHGEILSAKVQFFYNSFDDYIFQQSRGVEDPDEELPIFDYVQEEATFRGVEAELEAKVTDNFSFRIFGDSVRATLDDGGDVPRVTPQRFGLGGTFRKGNWDFGLTLINALEQDNPGDGEEETDSYTNLSARINYQVPLENGEWLIFLHGDNLLDDEIRSATSFLREAAPEPGLNLTLGMRLVF